MWCFHHSSPLNTTTPHYIIYYTSSCVKSMFIWWYGKCNFLVDSECLIQRSSLPFFRFMHSADRPSLAFSSCHCGFRARRASRGTSTHQSGMVCGECSCWWLVMAADLRTKHQHFPYSGSCISRRYRSQCMSHMWILKTSGRAIK